MPLSVYRERRARLAALVQGPVLLAGPRERPRHIPYQMLPFRQDSTLLYFVGCHRPGTFAWLEAGTCTLYVEPPAPDDALWHGVVEPIEALVDQLGVDAVRPVSELPARAKAQRPRTLAVADERVNSELTSWVGQRFQFGEDRGDAELIDAVSRLRRAKDAHEIGALRAACTVTAEAHKLVMAATRPGVSERALAAVFEGYLASRGTQPGYGTILTQRGEVLHNHGHEGTCEAGRLLLLDGGAEVPSGYTADVTRTWPVSGRYSARQRAVMEAVLAAQQASLDVALPGVSWVDVHLASARVIAQFALDEGLLHGLSVDEAVERGAHALFLPHGVGHLLGLDVHDLAAYGDAATYPKGTARSPQFGLSYLRLGLPLEAGWVVTIEPGFYVVPAVLADAAIRAPFAAHIDDARLETWLDFGGVRIEDDVHIRPEGPEILSAATPKDLAAIEALVGTRADVSTLLRG